MSEIRSCQFASWSETYQITDPKEIWNKIDWKGNRGNRDIFNYRPEIEDLGNRKIQPQMKMFLVSTLEFKMCQYSREELDEQLTARLLEW